MIAMREVIPEFLPYVEGCPNPLAIRQLRNTLMDFCRQTECWRYRDDYVTVIKGRGEVELTLPEHSRVIKVHSLTFDGHRLNPASEAVLDQQVDNWRQAVGTPVAFYQQSGSQLYLYPKPAATSTGRLQASLILAPTRTATEVDENLLENWLEGLIGGVLYRLRMMPGQLWTDPEAAAIDLADYQQAVAQALRVSRNDHYNKSARVTAYGGY